MTDVYREVVLARLGEGVHAAFRKGSDSDASHTIWDLIRKMPNEEWFGILDFVYECIDDLIVVPKE